MELKGKERGVGEKEEMLGEIEEGNGGGELKWKNDEEERERMWRERKEEYIE